MSSAPPTSEEAATERPKPQRKPLLRLELRDLSQPGAQAFLRLLSASTALEQAVDAVLYWLYKDLPSQSIPPTRSVTLVLRSMPGVAYTTGKDLDDDHKEIHFSTDYIAGIPENRQKEEMLGVIRHEMVHCWQWAALGTAPGGLIEGVADWVRLRSNFVPPHWKQEADGDWDAGYQHTGYFLEYLENRFGSGSVGKLNDALRNQKYEEEKFWKSLFGETVGKLWEAYGEHLHKSKDSGPEAADADTEKEKVHEEERSGKNSQPAPAPKEESQQKITKSGGKIHIPRRPPA